MPALMTSPTKIVRGQPVGTPTTRRTTVAASQDWRTRKTREAVLSSTNPPMSKASIAAPPGRSVYQCDVEPLASSLVLRRLPGTSARAEAALATGHVDRSGPDEDPDRACEGEQSGQQHAEGQTRHGDDEREQSRNAELTAVAQYRLVAEESWAPDRRLQFGPDRHVHSRAQPVAEGHHGRGDDHPGQLRQGAHDDESGAEDRQAGDEGRDPAEVVLDVGAEEHDDELESRAEGDDQGDRGLVQPDLDAPQLDDHGLGGTGGGERDDRD